RVHEHDRRLRDHRDGVLRRLAVAVRHPPPRLGRPVRRAREAPARVHVLHLDPRDASAAALRPADVVRLEDPAAARDAQPPGHRDHRRLMSPYDPTTDVIEVIREPAPSPAAGVYRAFGETLRGLKTTFARIVEGPTTIQYPEEKTPVY